VQDNYSFPFLLSILIQEEVSRERSEQAGKGRREMERMKGVTVASK